MSRPRPWNLLAPLERVRERWTARRRVRDAIRVFLGDSADWPLAPGRDPGHSSRLLIHCNTNWACSVEQHLLFAAMAECAGCTVLLAGSPLAEAYWRAMGFGNDRFVPWRRYQADLKASAAKEADSLLSQFHTFDELRSCTYHGVDVGKHALSAVGRTLYRAYFDPAAGDFQPVVRRHLTATILEAMVMDRVMSRYGIDQVLMNEPNYSAVGVSQTAVRQGKCYIQFCNPLDENGVVFKRYLGGSAVNPVSLSDTVWSRLKGMPLTPGMETDIEELLRDKYSNKNLFSRRIGLDAPKEARDVLIKKLDLDAAKKTAVIFSHVLWDANMFWGTDLFPGGAQQWLVETVGMARRNPHLNWIIKVHPANVWKMKESGVAVVYNDVEAVKETHGRLPGNFRILLPEDNISPMSLFALTDVGFTIRGTVGMELPVLGIPCVTAGTGRYSGHGFTLDPPDRTSYENTILDLHHVGRLDEAATALAKRFFWGVFKGRMWRSKLFTCNYPSNDPKTHHVGLASWRHFGEDDRALQAFLAEPREEDYFRAPRG